MAPTRAPWRQGRRRVHGGEQRRRHLQVQRKGAADPREVRPEAWAGGARERRSRRGGATRGRRGWEGGWERERWGRAINEGQWRSRMDFRSFYEGVELLKFLTLSKIFRSF